jgi:hypothetical protein
MPAERARTVRVDGISYGIRWWEEIQPAEHAEWLAMQTRFLCPTMPEAVIRRLTVEAHLEIYAASNGRPLAAVTGEEETTR